MLFHTDLGYIDSNVKSKIQKYRFANIADDVCFPGRYYSSVVAYNGALEPSEVVCSDGITYDSTPPTLLNVSITHARGGHTVGCTQQEEAWLVNTNLTRVALSNVTQCQSVCSINSSVSDVGHLPLSSTHVLDEELSEHYCQNLPGMTEDTVTVLPSDYVKITWQGQDEESQLEEYYIGMGGDRTASSAPDLLPYTATHGHTSYHARHAGLGHGDLFFIFVRAVNKAGLSTTLTVGPVLIDQTPPDVMQALNATVEGEFLMVTWQEDVFTDQEQPDEVDLLVTFRVGQYLITYKHWMKWCGGEKVPPPPKKKGGGGSNP